MLLAVHKTQIRIVQSVNKVLREGSAQEDGDVRCEKIYRILFSADVTAESVPPHRLIGFPIRSKRAVCLLSELF